jgi:hypothetical protein
MASPPMAIAARPLRRGQRLPLGHRAQPVVDLRLRQPALPVVPRARGAAA